MGFCFLAQRGPAGGLLLLQCFSGGADEPGISRYLHALLLSSSDPCFVIVFSLILIVACDDTYMS